MVIASAVTRAYTLRKKPALALAFHGAVAVAALVVAGMMRRGIGLPTAVGAQFLFYFAGILIACEMAVIVFVQGVWAAIKPVKGH